MTAAAQATAQTTRHTRAHGASAAALRQTCGSGCCLTTVTTGWRAWRGAASEWCAMSSCAAPCLNPAHNTCSSSDTQRVRSYARTPTQQGAAASAVHLLCVGAASVGIRAAAVHRHRWLPCGVGWRAADTSLELPPLLFSSSPPLHTTTALPVPAADGSLNVVHVLAATALAGLVQVRARLGGLLLPLLPLRARLLATGAQHCT